MPWMNGWLGVVLWDGLRCPGRTGGRASSLGMDSNALDERVAGCRPSEWTPVPWMNGWLGIILVMDSDTLDERVSSFVMDSDALDGRVTGLPPAVVIGLMDPDADKRAAGYRLSRWTLMSWMVGWPVVVPRDGL